MPTVIHIVTTISVPREANISVPLIYAAPQPVNPNTGQHGAYWILSDEERAKGWQRPYRDAYVHVGRRPTNPVRDLTAEEKERYKDCNYVVFEAYPDAAETSITGCFWTAEQLKSGCGAVTRMAHEIAETYARDPGFYGATFCVRCRKHLPVAEFIWDGTNERVGS